MNKSLTALVFASALVFAGQASQFKGSVPVFGAGVYDVTVYAHSPETGNTGLDRTTFIVAHRLSTIQVGTAS